MVYDVQMTEPADRDLEDIIGYIAKKLSNPGAAVGFLEEFLRQKGFLSDSPYMFPLCSNDRLQNEGYHRVLINKNFIALFLIDDENKKVTIMRIFYAKRNYEKLI
jgi:toxin ParE1/3/4